jgi:hypothetical protein
MSDMFTGKITAKLARAAVGTATMVVAAGQVPPNSEPILSERGAETAELRTEIQTGSIGASEESLVIRVPIREKEFGAKEIRRFQSLATKRALQKATAAENEEFQELQELRRISTDFSPEEVISEYRRRKFLVETVDFLERHVQFLNPEDQEKLRSFGKAH